MSKRKILIFIEVDVVVRHFIDSDAFNDLCEHHDVTFVFAEPHKRLGTIDPAKLDLPAPYIVLPHHAERTRLWKQIFQIDQLRLRPGKQAAALRKLRRYTLGWKASTLYTVLGLPGIWELFRAHRLRQIHAMPNHNMEALLDRESPDLILHPCVLEGLFLNDLIELGQAKRIPLSVIMNSWDNPSTKRAMVGNPDWLLVWGPQTQNHAIAMANMPKERTLCFGAAQFDIYRQPPRLDRAAFRTLHGLDNDVQILLYAGSSKGTDEIAHLKLLNDAIENGKLGNTKILYRPHPWGNGGKGGETLLDQQWQHVVIESSMRGYLENVRNGITAKYLSDYKDTHDVLSNVDAVVSPLSTILLEAAMHGKPILCFLPNEDQSGHFASDAGLSHFHDMFRMPEILMANGYNDLLPQCVALMQSCTDPAMPERLAAAVDFFVTPHDSPYAKRLTAHVETITSGARAH